MPLTPVPCKAPAAALVTLLMLFPASAVTAEPAGEVVFARGVATATSVDGTSVRVLGKGGTFEVGETLTTGAKSFVVLEFLDDTRMTLRPDTVFEVESFSTEQAEESATMRLFKGGLRAITGFISKRKPDAFKVNTPVATIGIRGTEFDARLCEGDCSEDEPQSRQAYAGPDLTVSARVAFIRGEVTAAGSEAGERVLITGSPLYVGDTVTTARRSFAVLAFRDESRVTVTADSAFAIEAFEYADDEPEEGSAAMRLLRGGLRAVSGLIGRYNRDEYRFNTPVATIGIRGTGFDLYCTGACAAAGTAGTAVTLGELLGMLAPVPPALAQGLPGPSGNVPGDGFYASIWDGTVIFELPSGELIVEAGKIFFLPNGATAPIFLDALPFNVEGPRPDEVDVDHGRLFSTTTQDDPEPGLYVSCYSGHCSVDDETTEEPLELGANEASHTNDQGELTVRLKLVPPFQSNDPFLNRINEEFDNLFYILEDELDGEPFECNVL